MITEEDNKNKEEEKDKYNSRSPLNHINLYESSSKSQFSEESSHRVDINFGFSK